jgi:hypothetical protein
MIAVRIALPDYLRFPEADGTLLAGEPVRNRENIAPCLLAKLQFPFGGCLRLSLPKPRPVARAPVDRIQTQQLGLHLCGVF